MQVFGTDAKVVEKVCHAAKYLIRALGPDHILVLGTAMLERFLAAFQAHPFDAYIYAANEVISVVGRISPTSPSYADSVMLLESAFASLNTVVMPRLSTEGDFKEQPHLVEEWMECQGRMLRRNPLIVFSSQQLPEILQRSYGAGLYMGHENAAKSVCLFFEHLLSSAIPREKPTPYRPDPQVIDMVQRIVVDHGEAMVQNLLGGVAGFLHRRMTTRVRDILELIVEILGGQHVNTVIEWVELYMQRVPVEVFDVPSRDDFMNMLFVFDQGRAPVLADRRDMLDALHMIEDMMMRSAYLESGQ